MEPASTIIGRFGGVTKVAELAGVTRVRVSNWKRPKSVGGTGGRVPQSHHVKLLAAAERLGIELTAADFLPPPASPPASVTSPAGAPEAGSCPVLASAGAGPFLPERAA